MLCDGHPRLAGFGVSLIIEFSVASPWYISAMQKTLAFLAVLGLLATMGVVSGQSAPEQHGNEKPGHGQAGQQQAGAQNGDQTAPKSPSVIVQVGTPPSDAESNQSREDIRVQRELAQYTGLLVLVGFLQAAVLAATLWVVRRQATIMGRQTEIMTTHAGHLESLAAAADASSKATTEMRTAIQSQAELMQKTLVLQFRPRVVIRGGFVEGIRLADTKEALGGQVEFVVVNSGGTPARIFKSQLVAKVVDYDIAQFSLFDGATSLGEFSLQPGEGRSAHIPIDLELVKNIREIVSRQFEGDFRPKLVYFVGTVWYKDDLGIERSTGVFRKFDPKERSFLPVKDSDVEYSD